MAELVQGKWWQEGNLSINIQTGEVWIGNSRVGTVGIDRDGKKATLSVGEKFVNDAQIAQLYRLANSYYSQGYTFDRAVNTPRGLGYYNDSGNIVKGETNAAGEVIGTVDRLEGEITDASELAKAENEARFNTGLQQLGQLRDRTMSGLSGLGQSSRNEIMGLAEIDKAKANQSNISRGLYNTTIPNSDINGINKRRDQSLLALNEQLRREKTGADIDLTKTMENFRVNRTDVGPDIATISKYLQELASAGG